MRTLLGLALACLAAAAPIDARAERPLTLFLLPPLVGELIERVVPLQVDAELVPQRRIRLWILESRYCGAGADGSGRFVAIAAPGFVREDAALRRLAAADCRRGLLDVARASAAARAAQPWVAAVELRALWESARLRWKLVDGRAAGPRYREAPSLTARSGGLTIAELDTSKVRIALDDRLDLKVQLAAAFFDGFARVSVSRSPLESAPQAGGPPDRADAPPDTRAIAQLPNAAVNAILERDVAEQELVFEHRVSGEQRFSVRNAKVAIPDPETYALSGRSVHLNTAESFAIDVVFRGEDLRVESMTLTQQLEDCGRSPPLAELEAWTLYTECMTESALRRGAAELGSALLTQHYRGRTLRPTGPPTPFELWLGDHHLAGAVSILKASIAGDGLALYLEPALARGAAAR